LREGLRLIEERERIGEAKLKALKQAARQGWADVSAGRYADVADDQLEDFVGQMGRRAAQLGHDGELMLRYRLSDAAQIDVINILAWTYEQFGEAARLRCESLIVAALRDVATQPDRPGSIAPPDLGAGVRSWHLRLSRDHVGTSATVVRLPRHFLVYRFEPALLVVGRVLHDAMELARHLDPDTSRE